MRYLALFKKLEDYSPKDDMITSGEEVDFVSKALCFDECTLDDLRNMRDFCVMLWGKRLRDLSDLSCEETEQWCKLENAMMSITSIIDDRIFKMGGEV